MLSDQFETKKNKQTIIQAGDNTRIHLGEKIGFVYDLSHHCKLNHDLSLYNCLATGASKQYHSKSIQFEYGNLPSLRKL